MTTHSDIHIIKRHHQTFILVGTAHISQASADLVKQAIETHRPDRVCLELDPKRYESLTQKNKWESLNLRQVFKQKKFGVLLVQLILANYQQKMSNQLGTSPGVEFLKGDKIAKANNIPVSLCDREVGITLKRAWKKTPIWQKLTLISSLLQSFFDKTKVNEQTIENLKSKDPMTEMMNDLQKSLPMIKTVLIDERDQYLARKIVNTTEKVVLAVVGAGHIPGMIQVLEQEKISSSTTDLEEIPKTNFLFRFLGWFVPLMIISAVVFVGFKNGWQQASNDIIYWFVVNAVFSGLFVLISLPKILTFLVAVIGSPFTSMVPVIGVGYLCALTQMILAPPLVVDLKNLKTDFSKLSRWWSNKALKLFLVLITSSLGSTIGTWAGGAKIISSFLKAF